MTAIGLPTGYVVEAQIRNVFGELLWADLSGDLYQNAGITITYGRQSEQADITPARAVFTLLNPTGTYTAGRASSPYFPYIQDGAQVRIRYYQPISGNLLDNPGFEDGLAEWRRVGGAPLPALSQSTTHVRTGAWAGLISWATNAGATGIERGMYRLTPGVTYTVSFYVWVPTGSPAVHLVVPGLVIGGDSAANDAWTRITATFTATATSHQVQIIAGSSTSGQQCWTDDGMLNVGNTAAAFDPAGTVRLDRFTGYLAEAPTEWVDEAATLALSTWTCTDILERIADRAGTLRPFDVAEALLDAPVTYLPLDEPDSATQAGNLGSAPAAATVANVGGGGAYAFAGATGPPADGTSSLVLTPASATSGYYLRAQTYLISSALTVEAFINTTTNGRTIFDGSNSPLGGTGFSEDMCLSLDGTGKLKWTSDYANLVVTSPSSVATGTTKHVAAVYTADGTNHTVKLYVDGAQVATGSYATPSTLFGFGWVTVGGGVKLALFNGTINHVGLYSTALSATRIKAHRDAGVTGFGGERSDQRFARIAAYAGLSSLIPANRTGVWVLDDAGLSVLDTTTVLADAAVAVEMGSATVYGQAAGGSDYLTELRAVAATEGGLTLAGRSGQLLFQARSHRYNRPAAAVIDQSYLTAELAETFDTANVINDVTATTQDGAAVRVTDTASVAQRGTFATPLSSLSRDAGDVGQAAGWLVNRNATPRPRYPVLPIRLHALEPDAVLQLLRLEVSDRLDVATMPTQAAATALQLFAEGFTETANARGWTLHINASSAAGYQVWVLDHPTQSVLDGTTVLAY